MSFFDRFRTTGSKGARTPKGDAANANNASEEKATATTTGATKAAKAAAVTTTGIASDVLYHPIVTEKSTMTGTYVFAVNPTTNKQEVKKAVKEVYGVEPVSVNIMNVRGKKVRWNYRYGQRKNWKKAVVRLQPGDSISVNEV